MHQLLRTFFIGCALVHSSLTIAQCPACTPDLSCTISPAFPTLCPAQPPAGVAGEYYSENFTFWMPATFSDPGSGVSVEFEQMTVTSVSGTPFGLSFETNDPAGVYFPQQNEYGCATLCGTPLIAGIYTITVDILATVLVAGFTTQVPEQFILTLIVAPGSGGNSTFSFTPNSGCGSLTTTFQALIDGSPLPTSYVWDFGNGTTINIATPEPQVYTAPGEYVVSLQTTIGGHVLENVTLTGVNGNWCGDVEEPNVPFVGCSGSPDLFYVLTDANGNTIGSGTQDNTFSATWSGLNTLLSTPPYSISFYDEDGISQNDLLGTYNIPIDGSGMYFINVAGGTTGSLTIGVQPQQTFFDQDTIVVHPLPEVTIIQQGNELCAGDTSLIGHIWLLDGDTLTTGTDCIDALEPGSYQLIASSPVGCTSSSDVFVVCPEIEIVQLDNILSVPAGFINYTWSFNGTPIPGANNSFVIIQGVGSYSVTVDAGDGCIITAMQDIFVAVQEFFSNNAPLTVRPLLNNGSFEIEIGSATFEEMDFKILESSGRVVYTFHRLVGPGITIQVHLNLPCGNYIITSQSEGQRGRSMFTVID
jgi:hypothetical protein